jgi:hypothetical protein
MTSRPGFTLANWNKVPVFDGRCATPADVEHAVAVFALADTFNGNSLTLQMPAPVIWYAEDEEFSALVVQAESHETEEDDEPHDFYGLLLPSGGTAVVFAEDLEFVAPDDPVWQALLEADVDEDQDDVDDGAEWARDAGVDDEPEDPR